MCVAELCAKSGWWKGGAGKGRVLGGQCPPPHGPTLPLLLFVALLLSPLSPPPPDTTWESCEPRKFTNHDF